jgi:hypothetical protein
MSANSQLRIAWNGRHLLRVTPMEFRRIIQFYKTHCSLGHPATNVDARFMSYNGSLNVCTPQGI